MTAPRLEMWPGATQDDIDTVAYVLAKTCADHFGDIMPESFDLTLSRRMACAAIAAWEKRRNNHPAATPHPTLAPGTSEFDRGRASAIEEAAKVADDYAKSAARLLGAAAARAIQAAQGIAGKIRSLAPATQEAGDVH